MYYICVSGDGADGAEDADEVCDRLAREPKAHFFVLFWRALSEPYLHSAEGADGANGADGADGADGCR